MEGQIGRNNRLKENIFRGTIEIKFWQKIINKTNKLYKFIIKY